MPDFDCIARQLEEVEALVRQGGDALALRVPRLSGWSVAQQLDHLLRAAEGSVARILAAPEALPRRINLTGRVLLGLRWFPRGQARAPRGFEGRERSTAELAGQVVSLRAALTRLAGRPDLLARPEAVVPHPYFGGLTAAQALRMVAVHDRHHLKIVRDLRRAARTG